MDVWTRPKRSTSTVLIFFLTGTPTLFLGEGGRFLILFVCFLVYRTKVP